MQEMHNAARVGGAWLALASFLIIMALVLHGPIEPELSDQMTKIANGAARWSIAHWIAAVALSAYAIAGIVMLTSKSHVIEGGWARSAWAVLAVGSLWTMTTAIAEATVVTNAAVAGNAEVFNAWWMFAEGKANGFSFAALAVAVIARHDARSADAVTPRWAAQTATVAGVAAFFGWALGMWFGIRPGSLLWLASSIVMSMWTLWFGVALARAPVAAMRVGAR
jgi:hypothetical protein